MHFQINKTLLIFYQLKQATCPRNQEVKKKKEEEATPPGIFRCCIKRKSIWFLVIKGQRSKSHGIIIKERKAGEKGKGNIPTWIWEVLVGEESEILSTFMNGFDHKFISIIDFDPRQSISCTLHNGAWPNHIWNLIIGQFILWSSLDFYSLYQALTLLFIFKTCVGKDLLELPCFVF